MKINFTYIFIITALTLSCGCSKKVKISVSNQSFSIPAVDIVILIDGKEIINKIFPVKGQHYWEDFQVNLPAAMLQRFFIRTFNSLVLGAEKKKFGLLNSRKNILKPKKGIYIMNLSGAMIVTLKE